MFNVSDKARKKIEEVKAKEGSITESAAGSVNETFLRVGVTTGGCSGLSYELEFDANVGPGDQVFEDNGIKVIISNKSVLYLIGTTLDFSDGLEGKGFNFINPNASRTCACGESFSV